MTIMGMMHLGGTDFQMTPKHAAKYKVLKETRRPGLLKMAKKMKLKVKSDTDPASHADLLEAIAKKKGLFHA